MQKAVQSKRVISCSNFSFLFSLKLHKFVIKHSDITRTLNDDKSAKSMVVSSVGVCSSLHNQVEKVIVFLTKPHLKERCGTLLVSKTKLNYSIFLIQPFTSIKSSSY